MKNKNVILYTRVSTKEQADTGYSLIFQKEQLEKYCGFKNYNNVKHFEEDYSAKTFTKRKKYQEMKQYIKANHKNIDALLFVKWDRFSRNLEFALTEIRSLASLGVDVECMEQPLDLNIPENLAILATYLAFPEIENKRISQRVKGGMVKAAQLGCYMGSSPIGYTNGRDSLENAVLQPNERAEEIKMLFKEVATGTKSVKQVREQLKIKESVSTCQRILRNKVYIGKVRVPEHEGTPEYWKDGLHEALIDEATFYKVQDVLDGRVVKTNPKYSKKRDDLYLRDFLRCPVCNRKLTGGPSKGNGGVYYYYYCGEPGHTSFRADKAHNEFTKLLYTFKPKQEVADLYIEILKDVSRERKGGFKNKAKSITPEIDTLGTKLITLQDKWLEGKTNDSDYHSMKERIEKQIRELKFEQEQILSIDTNFDSKLDFGLNLLSNLNKFFAVMDIETKYNMIGLIFPEKLQYQKNQYQTTKINEFVNTILSDNARYREKIKKLTAISDSQSHLVIPLGRVIYLQLVYTSQFA
uniref:recombinase family protein n=1 Tax=uncultured Dysgonomonas sp. TaxID=206096 RepID=UPI00262BB75E|nr:recombinase family protein [uncultured Dysgonomonas sp.]